MKDKPKKCIKVLLIGHNSGDYSFLSKTLANSQDLDLEYQLECSESLNIGIERLTKGDIHVVLLDLPLVNTKPLEDFLKIHQHFPTIPIVIITNLDDDALALESVKNGAQDYLIKSKINEGVILRVIRYALERKQQEIIMRKKLEEAIELTKQAQQVTEMKSKFLAYMSHEIRVPMNAVLGFSQLLKQTSLNNKQKDYLETIISNGNLILKIINDILDLSKIESGRVALEAVHFDLDRLIQDVFKVVRAAAEEKSLNLNYYISPAVPTFWEGDPHRLKQILINLLNNAIKFTVKGYVNLTVNLDQSKKQKKGEGECILHFFVKDTGIGIPKEKQEMVFEAFAQADQSIARQYGGTGLGLTISKRLIEVMGGNIWVESQPGKGSEFNFTVKLKVGSPDLARDASQEVREAILKRMESLNCKGVRILLAEDSQPSQELMQEYFTLFGCEGDFVGNGLEVIEKIKKSSYDLCLMDVELPGLDGLETTRRIRKDNKELPIIALTASAMKEDQERCLKAGMNDYLTKPIDMMQLKEKIALYAGRKK